MTRLALAKTLVTGTVTLQGNTYTFTGSGSGTATADRVPEAKKLAVATSNSAASAVARDSINKILTENSAVLTDLEITNLISNNLSTTVVAFKPIALSQIASSTDGVNYTLNENVTIGEDQTVTIPSGQTLTGAAGNPFTNNGYFQIDGNFHCGAQGSKALKAEITTDYTNGGGYTVNYGGTLTIDVDVTFTNSGSTSYFANYGGTVTNNGTITNSGQYSNTYNEGGTFNNYGTITNSGKYSFFENSTGYYSGTTTLGIVTNYKGATITCSGSNSFIQGYGGGFTNYGTITNSGSNSYYDLKCWFCPGTCTGNCTAIT